MDRHVCVSARTRASEATGELCHYSDTHSETGCYDASRIRGFRQAAALHSCPVSQKALCWWGGAGNVSGCSGWASDAAFHSLTRHSHLAPIRPSTGHRLRHPLPSQSPTGTTPPGCCVTPVASAAVLPRVSSQPVIGQEEGEHRLFSQGVGVGGPDSDTMRYLGSRSNADHRPGLTAQRASPGTSG